MYNLNRIIVIVGERKKKKDQETTTVAPGKIQPKRKRLI